MLGKCFGCTWRSKTFFPFLPDVPFIDPTFCHWRFTFKRLYSTLNECMMHHDACVPTPSDFSWILIIQPWNFYAVPPPCQFGHQQDQALPNNSIYTECSFCLFIPWGTKDQEWSVFVCLYYLRKKQMFHKIEATAVACSLLGGLNPRQMEPKVSGTQRKGNMTSNTSKTISYDIDHISSWLLSRMTSTTAIFLTLLFFPIQLQIRNALQFQIRTTKKNHTILPRL